MNVAELIEALHVYPPDMEVVLYDEEWCGYAIVNEVSTTSSQGETAVLLDSLMAWPPLRPVFGPPPPPGHHGRKILKQTAKMFGYKPLVGFVGEDEQGRDHSAPPSPFVVWQEPDADV